MRTIDKAIAVSRRAFIERVAGAAALAGAVGQIDSGKAFAATLKTIADPASARTLLRVARDLFPHDRVPDLYYERAVATIDAGLAGDPATAAILRDGVTTLDNAAQAAKGSAYAAIASEEDRVALLKAISDTPFFVRMRGGMVTALYNQKEVWGLFGYEGASFDKGGYLYRGFNDIDWLPATPGKEG